MPGNMECLGFPSTTQEEFEQSLEGVFSASQEIEAYTTRHRLWKDPSGASMGFHLDKEDRIECLTPFYAAPEGSTRWTVESKGPLADPECVHCSGADCDLFDETPDGPMVTRSAVQWLFFAPFATWLAKQRRYSIEVAAFAHRASFFASEEEFAEGQKLWFGSKDGKFKIASTSYLPYGMFDDAAKVGVTARAKSIFAGEIVQSKLRHNTCSDRPFHQVRIKTLPGEIDVVMPAIAEGPKPEPEMLALIDAWIVGRPVEGP